MSARSSSRALLALVLLLACDRKRDPSQWPASRDEIAREAAPAADAIYRRYCVVCHGADGRGNGGITGADLTAVDGPLASKPDAVLIASVRDGKLGARGTMPPHKPVLSDAQIADVIRYVRARFAPDSGTPPAR